ncbi:peptidylprolyl isomerase [Lachnospiraceae bacterium]|nr:peptidylprolyl isomerase [Lachnospiraceae bacterium]
MKKRTGHAAGWRRKGVTRLSAVVICLCVAAGALFASGCGKDKPENVGDGIQEGTEGAKKYFADIKIQDHGMITIELDTESAPITTDNFIKLAEDGFYDGLTFHRIIEGFMMQGGDPDGNGTGGSENTIEGEFSENGHDNALSHTRGAVSMARSNDYNSASSQFFIVHEDSTFLDGQYAVFGYVTEGMDIVDEICTTAQPADGDGTIPADAQPVMSSVTIRTE